jgi:hypothetical protein
VATCGLPVVDRDAVIINVYSYVAIPFIYTQSNGKYNIQKIFNVCYSAELFIKDLCMKLLVGCWQCHPSGLA